MRILLCGFGTVAQALSRLLVSKEEELTRRYGMVPRVVGIIDSRSAVLDDHGVSLSSALKTKSRTHTVGTPKKGKTTAENIRRVDADVVVETTITNFQTGEPGISHIRGAFRTANKGPLAVAFHAVMELAHYNGVYFRFSGAVGGGTPVLDFGRSCAKGDRIRSGRGGDSLLDPQGSHRHQRPAWGVNTV